MPSPKQDKADEEVPITVRFPRDVRDEAKKLADADRRSFNLFVVMAVEEAIKEAKKRAR